MMKRPALLVGLGTALVLAAVVAALPKEVFWITDEGTKFIQLQNLTRYRQIAIVYPARDLDPTARFFPSAGHHFPSIRGEIFALFLPYFPLVSAIPYKLFGTPGIHLVPVLAAAALAVIASLLFRHFDFPKGSLVGPAVLIFATPVVFYAVTFWEHTLATLMSTAAVLLLLRSRTRLSGALGSGLLFGASTLFREEGYVFFAAVIIAIVICYRSIRLAAWTVAGWLVVMAPAALWHLRLYGHPLGVHAAVYAGSVSQQAKSLSARALALFDFLFRIDPAPVVNLLLIAPLVAALLIGLLSRPARWLRLSCLVAVVFTSMIVVIRIARADQPVFHTAFTQGLLPALPFSALFLVAARRVIRRNMDLAFLAVICAVFVVGASAALGVRGVWIIWGPRFFMPIFPLIVVLAWCGMAVVAEEFSGRRIVVALAGFLFLLGVLLQMEGLYALSLKKRATEQIRRYVAGLNSSVVVSDVFWIPQELAALFFEKKFLWVRSDAELAEVLSILRQRSISQFAFIASKDYRLLSNDALRPVVAHAVGRARIVTPGVDFLDVMVLTVSYDGWGAGDHQPELAESRRHSVR